MQFHKEKSIAILERTPTVLKDMLSNLDPDWTHNDEGSGSWSPIEIINHLILGEKTDWIVRAKIILGNAADKSFVPFDMESHKNLGPNDTVDTLLKSFSHLRDTNLRELRTLDLSSENLSKTDHTRPSAETTSPTVSSITPKTQPDNLQATTAMSSLSLHSSNSNNSNSILNSADCQQNFKSE